MRLWRISDHSDFNRRRSTSRVWALAYPRRRIVYLSRSSGLGIGRSAGPSGKSIQTNCLPRISSINRPAHDAAFAVVEQANFRLIADQIRRTRPIRRERVAGSGPAVPCYACHPHRPFATTGSSIHSQEASKHPDRRGNARSFSTATVPNTSTCLPLLGCHNARYLPAPRQRPSKNLHRAFRNPRAALTLNYGPRAGRGPFQ